MPEELISDLVYMVATASVQEVSTYAYFIAYYTTLSFVFYIILTFDSIFTYSVLFYSIISYKIPYIQFTLFNLI